MRNINKFVFVVLLILITFSSSIAVFAEKPQSNNVKIDTSKAMYVTDSEMDTVMFEKNATERLPIASMVKIMTLLIAFENVSAGNLSLDEQVIASENATSMGGSQAFLDINCGYTAGELIKSIIVASANDSCVAIAERIGGNVNKFVDMMNSKAEKLGMENTNFVNCTGLPTTNQYSCAKDVAKMTSELIKHKEFFDYSKEWLYEFKHASGRTTTLTNTNKLVKFTNYCDGGKTGFTNEAKFCLSATGEKNGLRIIAVVIGAKSSKERFQEIEGYFAEAFASYENKKFASSGDIIDEKMPIKKGRQDAIKTMIQGELNAIVRKGSDNKYEVKKNITKTCCPINKDEVVGTMELWSNGIKCKSVNIVSCDTVLKQTYLDIVDDFSDKW